MKNYTNLEQSKKLAEFLSLESADMHWQYIEEDNGQLQWFCFPKDFSINQYESIPCWSLSALLDMLEYEVVDEEGESYYLKIDKDDIEYQIRYEDRWNSGIETKWYDNPLDAAFEMILKLHERNLL